MPTKRVTTKKSAKHPHKYIFVVGGVMSGVGKGITTASIGRILESKGFRVSLIKADPYLNVDAGTMNPTEHGEVFVLDSGLETDQDMGNYERFLNKSLATENYMTNGMIFKHVIDKERALGYQGKCVEPVFHITEEILRRIQASIVKNDAEITVFEIGGTVGEYQNAIFLEAARMLKLRHPKDVMFVMVSYLPVPGNLGEMKTKPTQNAVRQLNSYGINADMIIARSEAGIDYKRKEKIALATGVPVDNVISAPNIESIYDVPINFEKDGLSDRVLEYFDLTARQKDLKEWRAMVARRKATDANALMKGPNGQKNGQKNGTLDPHKILNIAVIGKYFDTGDFVLSDAYLSVIEAVKFSSWAVGAKTKLTWINSKHYEKEPKLVNELSKFDGVIVPGGFGQSGIEGLLMAIRYAREHKVPYLGLCYGMQLMVIEYARNVLGWKGAHTAEIDAAASHVVIDVMPEQKKLIADGKFGGSMRLGTYPAVLKKGSVAESAYKTRTITERHRHRYEVNPEYITDIAEAGLVFSGTSPDGRLMEIAELPASEHPFFLGTQFHPELLARPLSPHPLFTAFVKAVVKGKGSTK